MNTLLFRFFQSSRKVNVQSALGGVKQFDYRENTHTTPVHIHTSHPSSRPPAFSISSVELRRTVSDIASPICVRVCVCVPKALAHLCRSGCGRTDHRSLGVLCLLLLMLDVFQTLPTFTLTVRPGQIQAGAGGNITKTAQRNFDSSFF